MDTHKTRKFVHCSYNMRRSGLEKSTEVCQTKKKKSSILTFQLI